MEFKGLNFNHELLLSILVSYGQPVHLMRRCSELKCLQGHGDKCALIYMWYWFLWMWVRLRVCYKVQSQRGFIWTTSIFWFHQARTSSPKETFKNTERPRRHGFDQKVLSFLKRTHGNPVRGYLFHPGVEKGRDEHMGVGVGRGFPICPFMHFDGRTMWMYYLFRT